MRISAIDEAELIDALDNEWRSPAQIRARVGLQTWSAVVADALERLADVGKIDRRSQDTLVRKHAGGNLTISQYRRRSL